MCALPSFFVRDTSACKGMLLRVGTGRLKHMSVGAVAVFGSRSPASHRALCACTSVFFSIARLLVARLHRFPLCPWAKCSVKLVPGFFGYGGRNRCILIFVSTAAFVLV